MTPRPAATRANAVDCSPASWRTSGSKPASPHAIRTARPKCERGCATTHGAPARSDNDTCAVGIDPRGTTACRASRAIGSRTRSGTSAIA